MLLLGVASAQEYAIRANRGLNLRVAPSLNADIADTVSSGSTLQVVGKLNRWLKIYRNGRDVWLADWVDYSRVESSEPTGSQPPTAPIDNCCHVDRQCQSDQQWVDGYWAYQNGQCAAPAQPAASAPANVDNCCFLDRQCQSNQEWIAGYQAFQRGQCAPPVPATGGNCCSLGWHCPTEVERAQGYWTYQINQCAGLPQTSGIALTGPVPRIEGSGRFRQHIEATLRFMKSVAPAWYNYVITGLDSIVEEPVHVEPYRDGQTTTCWAFANYRERKAAVQTCFMSWIIRHNGPAEFDQLSTAGALGHEACHIHTHEEGKYFATQDDEEELCTKMGTGAAVLIASALATGLNPNRGTKYFNKDEALNLLRQYCAEGYRSDLFCPTLQRLESIWRNVPYAVFPPGAPQW
ncbi:MAG: SH3 domain-containing protein [Chloroflexi bacterium]|nr:SH3 domain-containing protein [Chloroflexota bacterium]